jgi:hypothetical protein
MDGILGLGPQLRFDSKKDQKLLSIDQTQNPKSVSFMYYLKK